MSATVIVMEENIAGRRLARAATDVRAIARRLVAARLAAGLRPAELAWRARIGRNTLANWETGLKRPSVDQLALVLPILNVTLDYVYFGDLSRLSWETRERIEAALAQLETERHTA